MYFPYGETETAYLKSRDKKLGAVIEQLGHIDRTVDTDLFSSVVHHIIGQQISTKAQQTIWNRIQQELGEVSAGFPSGGRAGTPAGLWNDLPKSRLHPGFCPESGLR